LQNFAPARAPSKTGEKTSAMQGAQPSKQRLQQRLQQRRRQPPSRPQTPESAQLQPASVFSRPPLCRGLSHGAASPASVKGFHRIDLRQSVFAVGASPNAIEKYGWRPA